MLIACESLFVGRGTASVAGPIDLALTAGEAIVVTGPNGAGKSTLLRTLAGLLRPLAGRVTVSGVDAADGEPARSIAEIAHYVGHRNAMKPAMTVGANLDFWRRFLAPVAIGQRAPPTNAGALDALGLPDLTHLPFGYLSAGQQRRASLARLVAVPRPVWILDEPTAALDIASQARFGALMAAHLDRGGLVIAATHQPLGLETARSLDLGTLQDREGPQRGRHEAASAIDEDELAAAEGWL